MQEVLPLMKEAWEIDLVIANAENAASGSGITPRLFKELTEAGVQLMSLGDHSWKRKENLNVLEKEERLRRPHNSPEEALGTGVGVVHASGEIPVVLVTVLGRVFMSPVECPFRSVDRALETLPEEVKIRLVEIHAEATSEKIALGWHLDGRATCVFGTHTHVPTADERILPQGTAYVTDIGMTGPYDGVIGREASAVLHKFITSMHATFNVAEKNCHVCGAVLDADPATGKAIALRRFDIPVGEDAVPHSSPPPLHSLDSI